MTIEHVAWSLAHSLWQDAAIALATLILLKATPRRSAAHRYAFCMLALLCMVAAPALTLIFYDSFARLSRTAVRWIAQGMEPSLPIQITIDAGGPWTHWVVGAWLIGVVIGILRLLSNWQFTRRLVCTASEIVPPQLASIFQEMKRHFALHRSVRLMVAARVAGPAAIGWLRPVVLLPVTAVTGLDADQLKAVLAHELAHILRRDFALNVLQRSAESLLFYHPAVWWLSRRIRMEREHCCDDLALQYCGDELLYARALLRLDQIRSAQSSDLAVAASGSSLSRRVRRILGCNAETGEWQPAAASSLFVITAWLVASLWQSNALVATPAALPVQGLPEIRESTAVAAPPVTPLLLQMAIATVAEPQAIASVSGTVVKLGSGEPLAGTRVELTNVQGGSPQYTVTTGDNGGFAFGVVEPGEYRLLATRNDGYLPAEHGQRKPTVRGLPLILASGQSMKDIRLAMAPAASITGRVLGRDNQPAGRVLVHALRTHYRDGRRLMTIVQSVITNDRGDYRLFWLAPGQYSILAEPVRANAASSYVYVRPPGDQTTHDQSSNPVVEQHSLETGEVVETVQLPMYFPGTPDVARASLVDLRAGNTVSGILIRLSDSVRSRRIRGTVIDAATGLPVANAKVVAVPRSSGPLVITPNGQSDKDGRYELKGLVAGYYYLFALTSSMGLGGGGGRTAAEIGNADLENVNLTIPVPLELSGKFVINDGGDIDVTRLRAVLTRNPDVLGMPFPAPPGLPQTPPSPDGEFKLSSLGAGEYKVTVTGLPENAYVKSISMDAVDILRAGLHLDAPPKGRLEVAIGTNGGEVSGTVVDEGKSTVPNAMVVLIPELSLRYRMDLLKSVATDARGRFRIKGVAPGNYKLFAWEDVETGAWADPEFLRGHEGLGSSLRIAEGTRQELQLSLVSAR